MDVVSIFWHALAILGMMAWFILYQMRKQTHEQQELVLWTLLADGKNFPDAKLNRIVKQSVEGCEATLTKRYKVPVRICIADGSNMHDVFEALKLLWFIALTPAQELEMKHDTVVVTGEVLSLKPTHAWFKKRQSVSMQPVKVEWKGSQWHLA